MHDSIGSDVRGAADSRAAARDAAHEAPNGCELTLPTSDVVMAGAAGVAAAGDAAVEAPFCSTGIASGIATAFELPPDLDGQMCDISQLAASNAIFDEEEDVFGHGEDLGEAAYE